MELNPASLSVAERYKLLIGGVTPRPIALVSTLSPDGKPNLAPFSFFNGVGSDPMSLLFCPANNADGSIKDSLRNCCPVADGGTGQFVVNVVCAAMAAQMAACAEPLAYGESEAELADFELVDSKTVAPRRVAVSPLCFECETTHHLALNPGQPSGPNVVNGRVTHIAARDGLVNERMHVGASVLDTIGRMGGHDYCHTRDRFSMPAGRAALDLKAP